MSATAAIMAGIGAAGSLGGAAISSNAAGKAATAQAGSADYAAQLQAQEAQNALDFQKQVWGTQQQQQAPFLQAGQGAIGKLSELLGIPSSGSYGYNSGTAPLNTLTGFPTGAVPSGMMPNDVGSAPGTLPSGARIPVSPTGDTRLVNLNWNPTSTGSSTALRPLDFGSLLQGWNTPFTAPTNVTEQNDPGYQFRLQQGQQALERSAAAKGNLLTGGTGKALTQYGQDYASNEYNNVYNRALQQYQQAYNIFQNNQSNTYNRLASLSGIGQTSANQLGSAGSNTAGNVSNILLGTGSQIGQDVQNAAAARASGYVGSANAWSGAAGGLGNNLSELVALNSLLGNKSAVTGTDYGTPTGAWSP